VCDGRCSAAGVTLSTVNDLGTLKRGNGGLKERAKARWIGVARENDLGNLDGIKGTATVTVELPTWKRTPCHEQGKEVHRPLVRRQITNSRDEATEWARPEATVGGCFLEVPGLV
jgi:hypothetical protein